MGELKAFSRHLLPSYLLRSLEELSFEIDTYFQTYSEDEFVLSYEEHLKREFDHDLSFIKKGYPLSKENISQFLQDIQYFPKDHEDFLFFVMSYLHMTYKIPSMLEKTIEQKFEILSILLDLEYDPKEYERIVYFYFHPKVEEILDCYKIDKIFKQTILTEAFQHLYGTLFSLDKLLETIFQVPSFQLNKKEKIPCSLFIDNIDCLYQRLFNKINSYDESGEINIGASGYQLLVEILQIKELSTKMQQQFLKEANALNQEELSDLDRLHFLFQKASNLLSQQETSKRQKMMRRL